jgi:hypothetical protein
MNITTKNVTKFFTNKLKFELINISYQKNKELKGQKISKQIVIQKIDFYLLLSKSNWMSQ